ncbi:uncharacterized protein [Notamacropus eugenii]|uniref:uncharacterized protein n=1 Tax=Notamacropus eugenii TaxID=9315 RepID=UPI003B6854CA
MLFLLPVNTGRVWSCFQETLTRRTGRPRHQRSPRSSSQNQRGQCAHYPPFPGALRSGSQDASGRYGSAPRTHRGTKARFPQCSGASGSQIPGCPRAALLRYRAPACPGTKSPGSRQAPRPAGGAGPAGGRAEEAPRAPDMPRARAPRPSPPPGTHHRWRPRSARSGRRRQHAGAQRLRRASFDGDGGGGGRGATRSGCRADPRAPARWAGPSRPGSGGLSPHPSRPPREASPGSECSCSPPSLPRSPTDNWTAS